MPGGAKGALAAGPSPARHLGPACTPVCRQGSSQGCSCPERCKSCSALLLQPGGMVAAWPRTGDRAMPTSSRIRALPLRFSSAAQLSGTCRPCTAAAALCTSWRASFCPCHPHLAHGCPGMGPTPLARAGTLPTHPMPGVKRVPPRSDTSRFDLLCPQPHRVSSPRPRCLHQRCQHPGDVRRCRPGCATGNAPRLAPGQRLPAGTLTPGPLPPPPAWQ